MNLDDGRSTPRWLSEQPGSRSPTPMESAVLVEVLAGIRRVRHGSVQIHIQEGRVVQVDTIEKKRL